MTRTARGSTNEGGFTLVELLLAIAISAIVMSTVTLVVVTFLKTSDQTTGRLLESRDMQVTSAYFANDVAAVGTRDFTIPTDPVLKQSVEVGTANSGGLYPCGTSGTAAVRMTWDDVTKGPLVTDLPVTTVTRVAYSAQAVGGTSTLELHRLLCKGSGTPVSDVVIGHDLTVAPTVACQDAAGAGIACTGSGSAVPASITMTLKSQDALNKVGPVTVTLTGQRRQT